MTPRTAIVAGLGSGAAVALLLVIAFAALVPPPRAAVATPSPSAEPSPSGPTPTPSGPAPSASLIVAGFHVGEPAPALQVPQVGGGEIDLANLTGQPLWITFMTTGAAPSVDEVALMNDFAGRYADTGLVLLAIDVGVDDAAAAAFATSTDAHFPIGLDLDGAAQLAWDAPALPAHYWIGTDGVIKGGALGSLDGPAMVARLQVILPGVEVTPP